LINVVEHDSWGPARSIAAQGLAKLGEPRAATILDNLAAIELDSGVQRNFLVSAQTLRSVGKDDEQIKQLRSDLDSVREENRKLREQLSEILARLK
jgi:aminopeptidase N